MPKKLRKPKTKEKSPAIEYGMQFFGDKKAQKAIKEALKNTPAPRGVDKGLWFMHFCGLPEGKKATCFDCADFEAGICEGGGDPYDCFSEETVKEKEKWVREMQTAGGAPNGK